MRKFAAVFLIAAVLLIQVFMSAAPAAEESCIIDTDPDLPVTVCVPDREEVFGLVASVYCEQVEHDVRQLILEAIEFVTGWQTDDPCDPYG